MHRLAIGGVGYAASKLPKSSVRTNINLAKLGTVPRRPRPPTPRTPPPRAP